MNLNDAGKMVEKWYYELENKFPEIKCHQMIVMPDHFHCILQIVNSNDITVGADLCVCPDMCVCPSVHRVVQWFKTMTTNEYIRGVKTKKWQSFRGKLWQRNYYEHIIRNKRSYQNISAYILKNPAKWTENRI
jgi:REP element-mobilizing transposase RayT